MREAIEASMYGGISSASDLDLLVVLPDGELDDLARERAA
jgi:hypothetical protein